MALLEPKLSRIPPPSSALFSEPGSCRALLTFFWENKGDLPYAWRILNHGVCENCAFGVRGLRDPGLEGARLCVTRLKELSLNSMGGIEPAALADMVRLRGHPPERLRRLGRITYPMIRRREHKGFVRIGWREAIELIGRSLRHIAPAEMAFLAGARRLTNESYYVFQKLARALGSNNVDSRARGNDTLAAALDHSLGLSASTCSLGDLANTDLLLTLNAGVGEEAFLARCIGLARDRGAQVVLIETAGREHATARNGAGTVQHADHLLRINPGGAAAFLTGMLKSLVAAGALDREFIAKQTSGWHELEASLGKPSWRGLETASGAARAQMERLAALYGAAHRTVFACGAAPDIGGAAGTALVNLALARGMIGRPNCGILRLDGQCAGEECGALPDKFPGGFTVDEPNARRFSNLWRYPVSSTPGLNAAQMVEACHREEIKFLYAVADDLFQAIPNRSFAAEAIARVPFRLHQDIALNSAMLVEPRDTVLVLPAQTRYEQRSGGTVTTSDRRILFTAEISGHAPGEALPDWEIPGLIGRAMLSNGELLFPYTDTQSIREEMARVMPIYRRIEKLAKGGDEYQWGGRYLYKDGFSLMPTSRARFTMIRFPDSNPG
jgi:predicted molibdopterin-dependent oxidoreductase YjgC